MKINISNEVLAEIIGKIVTAGSRRYELGTIMTAELSFRQLVSTLSSLLLFALGKDNDYVAQFERVKPLLFKAEQERNTVVHSVWGAQSSSTEPHAIIRIKATAKHKKGLRTDFVNMGLEDLCRITDLIGEAYKELCLFELHFQEEAET
ncbi:MAG: hypothetical protein QME83_16810 [Thermodesulfobacteriota bacterium]|nr:hypothetical protein [Thermodesulfobacteriota bacterium]